MPETTDPDVAEFRARAAKFGSGYAAASFLFKGAGMTRLVRVVSWFIVGMAALAVGSAIYASAFG